MSALVATDGAIINHAAGTITYQALPCPLPAVWQSEFRAAAALPRYEDRVAAIIAIEQRARAKLGVQVTRAYIPPASEARPVDKWKIAAQEDA